MANHHIETLWMGKMQFNALVNDHTDVMDAPERAGGEDNGCIPKPFILAALSGCAGMELLSLLKKSKTAIINLNIKTSGELTKQIPYHYTALDVIFEIDCAKEVKREVENGINEVMKTICGVSFMLQKIMPVTWKFDFQD